jgi:tartrate-resistant acid phosphatase type 5
MIFILLACQNSSTEEAAILKEVEESTQEEPSEEVIEEPASEPSEEVVEEPAVEPSAEPAAEPAEEEPEPEPQIVRFIALGDGGEGNDTQYQVSEVMEQVCAEKNEETLDGCHFALYLGDNFYDSGVDGVDDPQFQTKFEEPYANLSFPFYVVLGNHDYGGDCLVTDCGGIGNEWERSAAQVDYTAYSDKWIMLDEYYTFVEEHVQFFGLDTNAIMWDPWFDTAEQQKIWIDQELQSSTATWKIAYGHHPYISNGRHGNAGEYEGLEWGIWADVLTGEGVLEFMDQNICGEVDIYLSGHDHNRQWLEPQFGTEFIVTGAAAKTTDLENRGNATFFEDDIDAGFVWIELSDNCLIGEFYDLHGQLNYEQQFCK